MTAKGVNKKRALSKKHPAFGVDACPVVFLLSFVWMASRFLERYDGNMCYMFGCRLCDFDVCDHCASMRHENILERVEAVERLQLATAKAGKAIRYKPSAQEVSPEDAEAYEEKESDSGPESEKSIDTANYPELEATVSCSWAGIVMNHSRTTLSSDSHQVVLRMN